MECKIEYVETQEYNIKEKIKHINIRIYIQNIILYNCFISLYYFINLLIKILNTSISIHTNFYIYEYFNYIILDFKKYN